MGAKKKAGDHQAHWVRGQEQKQQHEESRRPAARQSQTVPDPEPGGPQGNRDREGEIVETHVQHVVKKKDKSEQRNDFLAGMDRADKIAEAEGKNDYIRE